MEPEHDEATPISDRGILRWACREGIPCGVIQPGRGRWGRSQLVDLREGGPRPQLAIAQPQDLSSGRLSPLRPGDAVRIWSVRDEQPFHLPGVVSSVGVVEARGRGPVSAAWVRLPFRLLQSERRLLPPQDANQPRIQVDVAVIGPQGVEERRTLIETWIAPGGGWRQRGAAALVELGWRTLTLSLPRSSPALPLRGSRLVLSLALPDLGLRTQVEARVDAQMGWGEQLLCGLVLGARQPSVSKEEHRETLRRLSRAIG